jgi:hypothetical protein
MKPATLLRIASILTLLFCIGHTMGMPWTAAKSPEAAAVVEAMKALHFDAMGSSRSYWDFYFGFGLSVSVYIFLQACMLWFLASAAKARTVGVRGIVAVFFVAAIANAILTWNYFFIAPLLFASAIALCLGAALLTLRRT